ncbi:unnamed protein product, partial [Mesorhabditis spiculigera]
MAADENIQDLLEEVHAISAQGEFRLHINQVPLDMDDYARVRWILLAWQRETVEDALAQSMADDSGVEEGESDVSYYDNDEYYDDGLYEDFDCVEMTVTWPMSLEELVAVVNARLEELDLGIIIELDADINEAINADKRERTFALVQLILDEYLVGDVAARLDLLAAQRDGSGARVVENDQ